MANNINYYNALLGRLFDDGKEMPLRGGLNFLGFSVTPSQYGYDLALAAEVPASRKVNAGAGLTGGGDLSVDRTVDVGVADATIVVTPDAIKVGVLGPTNFADNTIDLNRLVQGTISSTMIGRNKTGIPAGWSECTADQLNLATSIPNTLALQTLVNAGAQLRIVGRRSTGAGPWEDCTAAQLNLLTTVANTIALSNLVNATAQLRMVGRKTAGAGAWEECTAAELSLLTTTANSVALANLVNATAQFNLMGRRSAGAGAWEQCTANQVNLTPVFNVKSYGAVGDGVTADDAAIAAARDAAIAAGGGVVFFPPGQYRMTATFNVNAATGVVFRGAGRRVSFIRPEVGVDFITLTGGCDGCGFEDIGIDRTSGAWPGAGATILINGGTRCFVRNVSISKGNLGVFLISCTDTVIENLIMSQLFGFRGISIEGTAGVPSERTKIINVQGRNPYGVTPVRRGNWGSGVAYNAGDVVFVNASFWQAQNTATSGATAPALPGGGAVATMHTTNISDGAVNWRYITAVISWIYSYDYANNTKINGAIFDGCDVGINQTGTGNFQTGLRATDIDIVNSYGGGLLFDRGNDTEINGCRIFRTLDNNGIGTTNNFSGNLRLYNGYITLSRNNGILLNGSSDIHIRDYVISNCSQAGAGAANGFGTGNSITNFSLVGCRIAGANHAAGAGVGSTCDTYVICDNDLNGNASALVDNSRHTATKRLVRDNLNCDDDRGVLRLTGRTTALAATNLFGLTPPAGLYSIDVYIQVTTPGSGTMDFQLNYQDDLGPTAYITSAGTERTSMAANSRVMIRGLVIRHLGGNNISAQTIFNSASGTYNIDVSAVRIGP